MKIWYRIFALVLALNSGAAAHATVATTAGSNLTAYNSSSMGSTNNNNWNSALNGRTPGGASGSGAVANFGNCNSLILRCAQPKCASGGCTSMDVAAAIVSGCVQSSDACKQHGDDLVLAIAGQLVASSTAAANAASANATAAAAEAAAAQSQQQMQQMQAQMQQMQAQMAQQSAAAAQQLQAAIEEQKQLAAQQAAEAAAAQAAAAAAAAKNDNGLTAAQVTAANNGVAADVLARQQISNQIMDQVDAAMVAMKSLKATMEDAFSYAGCDRSGNNCTGPKRVKMFKDKAAQFFDPYNTVLDEIYDALIMAQSVGVDISDIYMMLNNTCNSWAQYLCTDGSDGMYDNDNCPNGQSVAGGSVLRSGVPCTQGHAIPMNNNSKCQLTRMLTNQEEIQQNWLYPDTGSNMAQVRIGCASDALDNSLLFRNRKKQASIDIEILQRIIEQDAPAVMGTSRFYKQNADNDAPKYCAINPETYTQLSNAVLLKKLPDTVCVDDNYLKNNFRGFDASGVRSPQ